MKILKLQSELSIEELEMVRWRPLRAEMATPPSEEELESAVEKTKCGKAGRESGILPEMVKAVCYSLCSLPSTPAHTIYHKFQQPC